MRLQDKKVIVTGGASGIGRAICELFSQEGAGVIVADIDIEGGGETVSRIGASGCQPSLFVRTDVSSTADLDRLVHESDQFLGGIDILVNSAASFIFGNIEDVTRTDWNNVLGVNLIGASDAVKYALPYLKRSKAPSVVNIASIGSFLASPDFIPYCSSKGALLQLTRCLAMDLAKYNIRVNCVCPGAICTPATEKHISFEGADREEFLSSAAHASFLNRVGQPEEVAYAALFLASEESSFITGTPLMVDGGASAK